MAEWIDFKKLRQKIQFAAVLEKYNVQFNLRGKQITAFCPLPGHSGHKKKQTFSANVEKGIFQCFSCEAKGNVLDFCCLMDGGDPEKGADLRKSALSLAKEFKVEHHKSARIHDKESPKSPSVKENLATPKVTVNAPLDFALKNLDPNHPYFANKRLSNETVEKFGLGFCSRGHFAGRIAIPIHNPQGLLVGYAGRSVDETEPKYLFPGKRAHDNLIHEFRKTELLYNVHRIRKPCDGVIVVEGFRSVWWLTQGGFENVVALMGWSMSKEQEKLIRTLRGTSGTITFLFDGDLAGQKARQAILARFDDSFPIIAPELPFDTQPTDFSPDELERILIPSANPNPSNLGQSKTEMICSLINSFPCLSKLGFDSASWDAEVFERQTGKFSSGELSVAQFVLGVWNPVTKWRCGKFDFIEAASRLDEDHRKPIIDWFTRPWWP